MERKLSITSFGEIKVLIKKYKISVIEIKYFSNETHFDFGNWGGD